MGEELRHVHDQVAYHRKAGQRTQHDRLFQPVERGQTGEAVGVVDGRTESFSPEPSWGNGDLTAAVSNRPNPASQLAPERPLSQILSLRTGTLQSGRW